MLNAVSVDMYIRQDSKLLRVMSRACKITFLLCLCYVAMTKMPITVLSGLVDLKTHKMRIKINPIIPNILNVAFVIGTTS